MEDKMTFMEEQMILGMLDNTGSEMEDIIDFYGKDSVEAQTQKAYFQALVDVLNKLRLLDTYDYE